MNVGGKGITKEMQVHHSFWSERPEFLPIIMVPIMIFSQNYPFFSKFFESAPLIRGIMPLGLG
jgi:hypothetical protein